MTDDSEQRERLAELRKVAKRLSTLTQQLAAIQEAARSTPEDGA